MKAEYIEREPMIEEMQRLIDNVSRNFPKATETELIILKGKYEAFMEYIKEQPATDVQPVKRGKWCPPLMGQGKCDTYCERCHGKIMRNSTGIFEETPFCPHCGADMRGDENA